MLDTLVHQLQTVLPYAAGLSLFTFAVSLLCIPYIVARLPENYFQHPGKQRLICFPEVAFTGFLLFFARNILGLLLFLAGFAMLFLPGQGLITMIIGIGVMSFPYKRHLLYNATRPVTIQSAMDWIRQKTGKNPFIW